MSRNQTSFQPGKSGNPGGRPRRSQEVRELAQEHTTAAIKKLVEIMEKGESEQAQLMAANSLLDRGWGKPTQPLAGDPEGSALIDEHEAAILAEILRVASAGSENGADKDAK